MWFGIIAIYVNCLITYKILVMTTAVANLDRVIGTINLVGTGLG